MANFEDGLENLAFSTREQAKPIQSLVSPEMKAMIRIKTKYQALKKRRLEPSSGMSATVKPNVGPATHLPTGSENFILNEKDPPHRRKRRRGSRVLFPNTPRKAVPTDRSRPKIFFILFSIIISLQVYNAIENLDDHVEPYDLEGLEKTLGREVFGQQGAIGELMEHLEDYLSTYAHTQPLALALHGPTGVGKSHLGRLLARHFRAVLGQDLVVQYFTLHHCPTQDDAGHCARELSQRVEEVMELAEAQEKIPVFVLDEVEFMPAPLLDELHDLLRANQSSERLNVIYVLLSSLGQKEITRHVLQNVSGLAEAARAQLRHTLADHHPLWAEAALEIVPMTLLEKSHVMECLLEEMTQEGFYPDHSHIERLAEEMPYYTAMGRQYSENGCKNVVARVNRL